MGPSGPGRAQCGHPARGARGWALPGCRAFGGGVRPGSCHVLVHGAVARHNHRWRVAIGWGGPEVGMRMVKAAVIASLACIAVSQGAAAAPSITARGAVVMDAKTGAILWERDCERPLPPASTTKIVSAILALESGRLDESMRVSPFAASTPASKLYLRAGQRMRLEHLVYAMLLNSANDASVVVAEGLGGSQAAFGR